nr:molecular chaperone DnaK [Gemmatimonadales bacterium]
GEADGIRRALDELTQAYSAAGAALYQSAQAQGQDQGPEAAAGADAGAPGAGQDDVVEADYEIVDDKK